MLNKTTEYGNYSYGYDKVYSLTSAVNPTLDNENYTYDKVGNRLSSASTAGNWTYNNSDQLLTTPEASYQYNVNGHTKSVDYTDTALPDMAYAYDSRERLKRVLKTADGSEIQSNRYDYSNRRLVKTTASGTVYFLYGQSGLLAEYQSNGDFIQGYGYNPKTNYTTNPQYTITPKASGTGYDVDFYHNDHLSTPQKLTNSTGAISWAMESNAFGEATIKTQTTKNNLRFPGQYADDDIDLSQNYFRDYAPSLGRYVETDPIGLRGGINTYTYVGLNPIGLIDNLGLAGRSCEYTGSCPPTNTTGPFGSVCGGEGTWSATWVIPDGIFRNACQRHDDCYDCSGVPRKSCDDIFCIELQNACARYVAGGGAGAICVELAIVYCVAVKKSGNKFYKEKGSNQCPECEDNQE